MKEQLISFETAKLAKEKGFNIRTDFKFDRNNGIDRTPSLKYQIMNGINILIKPSPFTFAPNQSLLQKWLREVHNIYVESYHDLTSDGKRIQFYTSWGFLQSKDINGNQNVNGWYDEYEDWKTYEEALERGLQEGLKLINTKNNDNE